MTACLAESVMGNATPPKVWCLVSTPTFAATLRSDRLNSASSSSRVVRGAGALSFRLCFQKPLSVISSLKERLGL